MSQLSKYRIRLLNKIMAYCNISSLFTIIDYSNNRNSSNDVTDNSFHIRTFFLYANFDLLHAEQCPVHFQSSSATGSQFSAGILHLAERQCTSSGFSKSVECAPEVSTISTNASGLSSSGQGRRWFSLNG
jgi:hypothetical protein